MYMGAREKEGHFHRKKYLCELRNISALETSGLIHSTWQRIECNPLFAQLLLHICLYDQRSSVHGEFEDPVRLLVLSTKNPQNIRRHANGKEQSARLFNSAFSVNREKCFKLMKLYPYLTQVNLVDVKKKNLDFTLKLILGEKAGFIVNIQDFLYACLFQPRRGQLRK